MNIRSVEAAHGWQWIVGGMRLFRRNPGQWLLLIGALFVASRLLFLIPFAPLLVVLVAPHFLAGLAYGAQALSESKPLRGGYLISGFMRNARPLAIIGGVSLAGQVLTFLVIVSVGGDAFTSVAKSMTEGAGTPESVRAMQAAAPRIMMAVLTGFVFSLPLMMATWYAPLLVFFDDIKPAAALYLSLMACLKNALPLLVYGVALLVPLFILTRVGLAVRQIDLGLWLLAPLIVPSIYVSYRDLFVPTPPATT
jgi:hypothetical protein